MKVLIFGGTTEGRELAGECAALGLDTTVSVATETGAEMLQGMGCKILIGRLETDELKELVTHYDMVIDATHPFAKIITANLKKVCGDKLIRLLRDGSVNEADHIFATIEGATNYLNKTEGNILVTTGSKELSEYDCIDKSRLFVRVLPTQEALTICEKMSIPCSNIIALQGKPTFELNCALIDMYDIKIMVMKDSGTNGGTGEKLRACKEKGVQSVLIKRPSESGLTLDEVKEKLIKTASGRE